MKITQPLAESMALKQSLMEDVLKAYGDAAAYGVAEVTTAATFRLGEVYRQFSQDLLGPASLVFGFAPLYAALAPIVICYLAGLLLLGRAR